METIVCFFCPNQTLQASDRFDVGSYFPSYHCPLCQSGYELWDDNKAVREIWLPQTQRYPDIWVRIYYGWEFVDLLTNNTSFEIHANPETYILSKENPLQPIIELSGTPITAHNIDQKLPIYLTFR